MKTVQLNEEIVYVWTCPNCGGMHEEFQELDDEDEVVCTFCAEIFQIV